MRPILPERIEEGRVISGPLGSDPAWGPYGAFMIYGPCGEELKIIASGADETGWEHVSVSTHRRVPNWIEMCFVKNLFWDEEECVVQFHPPKSDYVNNHPYCLHLWKPTRVTIPRPPSELVGFKSVGTLMP